MKKLIPILLILNCQVSFGQYTFPSARSAGMGQASVTFQDANSLFGNQAGLAWVENLSVMAAAERRFSLSELSSFSAGIIVPAGHGSFGLVAQTYGFEAFRQQKIGLAYARKLWEKFSFGAQFDYLQTRIPEYGSKGAITFEAGILSQLTDEITLGVHIFSPAQVQFAENENFPTIFKMGMAWQASEKAMLAAELEKDIDFKARIKGGFEYRVAKPVFLRAGFGTNPTTVHFGLGFQLNSNLTIDAASSYHQVLGFSPSAAASWSK
jgi:hypothetical protein